jgi:hypothetical protein
MTATKALATRAPVQLAARAEPGGELLRSPVTGQPCVYWRLHIVEHLTARSELVHEIASPEPFDLVWGGGGPEGGAPVRIRLDPEAAAVIEGTRTLHRGGSPGARAVGEAFGFAGVLSVQEVVIRVGEEMTADGVLEDLAAGTAPFRTAAHGLVLHDATLRLPARSLGPVLLPWAVGAAAALFGGIGVAAWAAWRYHVGHLTVHHGHSPAHLAPAEPLRARMP